jgi:hypothetical protein
LGLTELKTPSIWDAFDGKMPRQCWLGSTSLPAIKTEIFERNFTTTPRAISPPVASLCRDISPDHSPAWAQVKPESSAVIEECFSNVSAKVASDGGSILYGWLVWEWHRVFIEAEHHAVWEKDGRLLDITPHRNGETTVLFLPDPTREYDFASERRLINRKRSLGQFPSVNKWIAATDVLHRAVEEHSVGREIRINRNRLAELQNAAKYTMGAVLVELASKTKPNDPCICTSGRKFKKCCGPLIDLHANRHS